MIEKDMSFIDDIPKYRKKSSAKGQPRSKHKHCYEPVLLKRRYTYTDSTNGKLKTIFMERPTMVCPICGRVGNIIHDPSFYNKVEKQSTPYRVMASELNEKALKLPKWYIEDFMDKFAKEGEFNV